MRLLFTAMVASACLVAPGSAPAQGTIAGIVQDTAKRPIADAEVVLTELQRRVRTDSSGRFSIGDVKAGRYEIRARRLGYLASEWNIVVRSGFPTTVVFTLDPRPQELDTVTVTASCARFEVGGFLCRAKKGSGGYYMDVDQIWNSGAYRRSDLFRDVPGFRVDTLHGSTRVVPTTGWKCLTELANGKPPSLANPIPTNPDAIIGIEAYAATDSIPPELSTYAWGTTKAGRQRVPARCSLIVYWTMVISKPLPRRVP